MSSEANEVFKISDKAKSTHHWQSAVGTVAFGALTLPTAAA
jgi:hypothetical protein